MSTNVDKDTSLPCSPPSPDMLYCPLCDWTATRQAWGEQDEATAHLSTLLGLAPDGLAGIARTRALEEDERTLESHLVTHRLAEWVSALMDARRRVAELQEAVTTPVAVQPTDEWEDVGVDQVCPGDVIRLLYGSTLYEGEVEQHGNMLTLTDPTWGYLAFAVNGEPAYSATQWKSLQRRLRPGHPEGELVVLSLSPWPESTPKDWHKEASILREQRPDAKAAALLCDVLADAMEAQGVGRGRR